MAIKTIFAMIFYLIIPILAICIILTSYDELSKDRFINIIFWIIPISLVIIIISQISSKYEKGTKKKYFLNIAYVGMTLLWVYAFLGGNPVITEQWLDYEFSIHLWRYILLIIIATIINMIYYTLEWRFYRVENNKIQEKNNANITAKKFVDTQLSTDNI
jgi:hypothetical protein